MALPLGAVLCFLDLLGARVFARGEVGQTIRFLRTFELTKRVQVGLQTTFHGPLAFNRPQTSLPIFTRMHVPSTAELETGLGPMKEPSFYRNAYAMVRGE